MKRIGKLAYKLDILNMWKIRPVIFVTHLEPAPEGPDPYTEKSQNPDRSKIMKEIPRISSN